jgi:Cu/Ag efflux protein CusF
MIKRTFSALLLGLACVGAAAQSTGHTGHGSHGSHGSHGNHSGQQSQAGSTIAPGTISDWADGEIRRIDRENGRLTIRHGDIPSLDMPPMSMVFGVRERGWLDGLKPGDRIRFKASVDQGSNKFTVVELESRR